MKYFRVIFHDTNEEIYIKAFDMDQIALWVLKTRPMSDYYGLGMEEVLEDKSPKEGGDLYFGAVRDYFCGIYQTDDDEVIRQNILDEQWHQPKKSYSEDEIKSLIQTDDKVLYGALKMLYACQTDDEQRSGETYEVNGKGFNGVDAPILSSFCEFLNKTGFLTPKQKSLARKKLVKYNKQLTALANE